MWIAFGSGARHFTSNLPFLDGRVGELIGQAAFGFGAVLICLVLIAIRRPRRLRLRPGAKS
jgi:hypothetical protein